jgi:hypothetical protein
MAVFARARLIFQPSGPGWRRFTHAARGDGRGSSGVWSLWCVEHILPLLI